MKQTATLGAVAALALHLAGNAMADTFEPTWISKDETTAVKPVRNGKDIIRNFYGQRPIYVNPNHPSARKDRTIINNFYRRYPPPSYRSWGSPSPLDPRSIE